MSNSKLINLSINEIELDRENPRIKQFLDIYSGEITAEAIALALSTSSSSSERQISFASLRDSIKTSGGIIHPIIVSREADGRYVAIEGNTRLQIYKDFHVQTGDENWSRIPSLVYENLTNLQKHEIRLQSHLVGPREWEPYSKAKYLWELSCVQNIPMNQLVDLCGGRRSEITKAIDTYVYMETHYRPYVEEHGYDFNTRDFSKFQEYQTPVVKRSIQQQGFDESKFAEWVAEGNVDKALGVRDLPEIMKNQEAKSVFLRKSLSEAEKIVAAAKLSNTDLSRYPMEALLSALFNQINNIDFAEIQAMAAGQDEAASHKLYLIRKLKSQIDFVLQQVADVE